MTRAVLYVACALRPSEEEIEATASHTGWENAGRNLEEGGRPISSDARIRAALRANLDRALRWLRWLTVSFPDTTFIAPWICNVMSGADDTDPAQREARMQGNLAVIERCDGIVLCGPRISEGMRREMEHGRAIDLATFQHREFAVYDLTPTAIDNLIRFPTWSVLTGTSSFADWYGAISR